MSKITPEQAARELDRLFSNSAIGGAIHKAKAKARAIPIEQLQIQLTELELAAKAAREAAWQGFELVLFECLTTCSCGAEHSSFEPTLWLHERNPHTQATRYHEATALEAYAGLPRVIRQRQRRATCCPQCFSKQLSPTLTSQETIQ